jgi:hypothetical protein
MEKMRQYLGDTVILAIASVYFYFVYMRIQSGFLHSFGLFDVDGLVPIQTQAVISRTVSIAFVSIVLLAIGLGIARYIARKLKHTKNKLLKSSRNGITLFLPTLIISSPILWAVALVNMRQFFIMVIYLLLSAAVVPLIDRRNVGKGENGIITDRLDKLLYRYSKRPQDHLTLMTTLLLLIYLPALGYAFGQITARVQSEFYVTSVDGGEYLVIGPYSNEYLLVGIVGNQAQPHYTVLKNSQAEHLDFSLKKIGRIDFSKIDSLDHADSNVPFLD